MIRSFAGAAVLTCLLVGVAAAQSDPPAPLRTGWDAAGFPLFNFTTDRGLGYGAYAATFYHGERGAGDAPYKASIGGQFYETTGGYAYHKLLLDFPNIADTGIRIDVSSGYETWDSAWYFGLGNRTPRLEPTATPDRFYESELDSMWFVPNIRVPITESLSLFSGLVLRAARVGVYPATRLEQDAPEGLEGGFLSLAQLGLMVDTRDREPTSHQGVFSEVSLRGAQAWTGSDYGIWGGNITHRQWWPLVSEGVLTAALRVGLDAHVGDVPFFHQHILGGSQWVDLGGNLALRGLPNGRHRGNVTAYSNAELRWMVSRVSFRSSQVDFLIVPFLDLGRVWVAGEGDDPFHLHGSVGTGFRAAYNDVFVVRFDVAAALEEFGDAVDDGGPMERRPVMGIYAIVNHPF